VVVEKNVGITERFYTTTIENQALMYPTGTMPAVSEAIEKGNGGDIEYRI
jgi:hypothetical protein